MDRRRPPAGRRLARPFEIVGVNAIFVFVCSGLLSIALSRNHVTWPPIDLKIEFASPAGQYWVFMPRVQSTDTIAGMLSRK